MKKQLDTIKLELSYDEKHKQLNTSLIINGSEIHTYTDIFNILAFYNKTVSRQPLIYRGYKYIESDFYPFTCSCGEAGCAGIWDGIYLKTKKWSVVWKVDKGVGYGFLDKTYYEFHKFQYNASLLYSWRWLNKNENLIISDWAGDEVLGDQLKCFREYNPEVCKELDLALNGL